MQLLSYLRHQYVDERWGSSTHAWNDFRAMVPMALVGHFLLDKHIAAIAACDNSDNLSSCFKAGLQDWFRNRDLKECLASPVQWLFWLQEYKNALTVSPEHFKKDTPGQVAADVFESFHYLQHLYSPAFVLHKPERLQVALLHIEHLPQNTEFYKHELAFWVNAKPELREKAEPEMGSWYNLVQDETMLRWHLSNAHKIDATVYALPAGMAPDSGAPL